MLKRRFAMSDLLAELKDGPKVRVKLGLDGSVRVIRFSLAPSPRYEFELVKEWLSEDGRWIAVAEGCQVGVVSRVYRQVEDMLSDL
jgi:hypothetical protein